MEAFLARHPPFDSLHPDALHALAAGARECRFGPGAAILVEDGPPAPGLFVVLTGLVELLHEGETVQVLEPGECFGHPSLLTGMAPAYTVRARVQTTCALLDAVAARRAGNGSRRRLRRRHDAAAAGAPRAHGPRPARCRHYPGQRDHAPGGLLRCAVHAPRGGTAARGGWYGGVAGRARRRRARDRHRRRPSRWTGRARLGPGGTGEAGRSLAGTACARRAAGRRSRSRHACRRCRRVAVLDGERVWGSSRRPTSSVWTRAARSRYGTRSWVRPTRTG